MLTYICPTCIQQHASYLKPCPPVGLVCMQCNTRFPIIDDTPILVSDLEYWLNSQREMVFLRTDLPAELYDLLLQYPSPLRDAQKQLYSYLSAPKSSLHTWLTEQLHNQDGLILDLGCGIGLHDREDIIGIDANWTLLQRYPGTKVVADIMNPPFRAKSVDCLLLINVIDSCTQPFLLLQQADALVKEHGTILFSSPFAWNDGVTPPKEQLSADWVRQFWMQKGYTLQEEEHDWFVQSNPRSRTHYKTICWHITRPPSEEP